MSSYAGLDVADTQLYVTDDQSEVWALDRNSGASLWKQDKLRWRSLTAPVVMNNNVVVADFEGYIHWLSGEDGRLVARGRSDSSGLTSAPIVVGEMLVAQGRSGELTAFRIENK
jgi:outer membrane protein assembly factor BamB